MKSLLLVITLAACGWGQRTKPVETTDSITSTWRTDGVWNGRFWKTLDDKEKSVFLVAYMTAVLHVATIAGGSNYETFDRLSGTCWPDKLTRAEVHDALDRFYETPENGPIGIPYALIVISKRSLGADEVTIQKMIADFRKPVKN